MGFGDKVNVRAHRRDQARQGFPLLRGCPSTDAIGLLVYLDRLSSNDQVVFTDQLSDFAEANDVHNPLSVVARQQLVESLPLYKAHYGRFFGLATSAVPKHDVRLLPVKVLAGVMKDEAVGGFEGWKKLVSLVDDPAAQMPPAVHAASVDEVVPVAPRRLRKLIDDTLKSKFGAAAEKVDTEHTKYTAPMPGGAFNVEARFARAGTLRSQVDYTFTARVGGKTTAWMQSYESVWALPSTWNYITDANAERSIVHFGRLIETCISLSRSVDSI